MGRKQAAAKWMVYAVIALLLIWPLQQTADWIRHQGEKQEPVHLLYQVSLFQMELLNSYLIEAGKSKETGELDNLKQSVYSAGFTHERLVLAVGTDELTSLACVTQLMQVIIRLQLGGERPLKTEEIKTLLDAAGKFKGIYESYGKLMSSGGGIVSSQNKELHKLDAELTEILRKKLLQ